MQKILLGLIFLLTIHQTKGQETEDSLQLKLKKAFSLIANNPTKAYQLASECWDTSNSSQNYNVQITSSRIIGQVLINKGMLNKADTILSAAIKLGENRELEVATAHVRINYGNLKLKRGSYEEALKQYNQAKIVFETNDDTGGIIKALTNMGICHMYFSNYEAASIKYHQALQMAQTNDKFILFQGLIKNNLGRLQIKVKNYDRAITYFYESIELLKQRSNLVSIARGQILIAKTLNLKNLPNEALKVAVSADSILNQFNDHQGITEAQIAIGEIYKNLNMKSDALLYFQKAKTHATKHELYELLNQAQIQLGSFYLDKNEFAQARIVINESISLARKLNNDENYYYAKRQQESLFIVTNQLDSAIMVLREIEHYVKNLEGNYDRIKLLERENDLGKMTVKIADLELSKLKKNYTIFWLAAVILFILLIGILIFSIIRASQKNALLKYEKNEEILKSKNLYIQKNKEIESIKAEIKGQEIERRRLAKELHDGLGGTLSSIKLYLSFLQSEQLKDNELNQVIERLDSACKEVRTISHHLTPPAFDNDLLYEAIEKFLIDLINVTDLKISHEIFPQDEVEKIAPSLKNDLYRIIQELVNNIIKHAKAQNVDLQLIMHEDSLSLIIEDDGIGFNSKSTNEGIGLKNIDSRLALHRGNMNIDTKEGRGTVINIHIPFVK